MTKTGGVVVCIVGLLACFALSAKSGSDRGATDSTAVADSTFLHITESEGKVLIEGVAPSSEIVDKVNEIATKMYGNGRFDNRLAVKAGDGTGTFWEHPQNLLPPLSEGSNFDLKVSGFQAQLSGSTRSADEKDGYIARLREVPALDVQQTLSVAIPPADAPKMLQSDLDKTVLNHTIEFVSNSADLSADGQALCSLVADKLVIFPDLNIEVDGYTDNIGSAAANLNLSERRAESVCEYLSKHGVGRSRLTSKGFGQEFPVASNDTDDGRYKNRRIAFKVSR